MTEGQSQADTERNRKPPQWELEMIADVADRWDIRGTEAENFLISAGAFGPTENRSVQPDTDRREDLAYGGICPICGDGFTNGIKRLKGLEGESIEGVRICVIDPPEETLFHLPEDQTDRSVDIDTDQSEGSDS